MLETLKHYCSVMQDIQQEGKEHLEKLKEMRMLCAFQSEVESIIYKGEVNVYYSL